jgi:alpha-beta hydrolase superfamily lysophospholipase
MWKKTWFKNLAALAVVPVLVGSAFACYIYVSQEAMIFVPTPLELDHQFAFDAPFEELTIPVDGAEINALHFRQSNPRGLIFFLHGNGGNLESWASDIDYYQRVNYDLFIFDYRGYGKSTGSIQSETQLHGDVRAAWNTVAALYREKPIVIYGRSLGTALAAKLAVDVKPALLILVSPFTSMVAMGRQEYPFLPEWLLRYPLRTDKLIGDIRTPTVLVHGDEDRLIPIAHTYELMGLANTHAKLLLIEGAGHNDIHRFTSYLDGLTKELPN